MTDSAPTWGISGPAFLLGFSLTAVVLWALALVLRRWGREGRMPVRALHAYELAYLDGGPRRTVTASLAALRQAGTIEAVPGGALRLTGAPPPAMCTPLDQAILQAVAGKAKTRDLARHPFVRPCLDQVRAALAAEGLLNGPGARTRIRLAALPLWILLAVGVARVVAGVQNGRPVGYLVTLMILFLVVALFLLPAQEQTKAGRKTILAAQTHYQSLRPTSSPDWASYGPEAAALGVAVFGVTALLSMDPAFAATAEIQHHLGYVASSSSGSSYTPTDSGSSCSSSSCSSSSCGGGGCGGGGCGG